MSDKELNPCKKLHIERNLSSFSSHSLPYCVMIGERVVKRCESMKAAKLYIDTRTKEEDGL